MLPDPVQLATNLMENSTNSTDANIAMNYMFSGLSTFSFLLITTLLISYSRGGQFLLGTPFGIGMLFFCALVTVIADLSLGTGTFRNIYVLTVVVVFGTLVNIYGSMTFFETPREHEASLGFSNSSVSVIIFGITIPLSLMELFHAIGAVKQGVGWQAAEGFAAVVQKTIQAGVYHFSIGHKIPRENRHDGASWYLKIIALFNLSMWVQSICDGNRSMYKYLYTMIGKSASVVSEVYAALVIDYRLLCFLLFVELAIQVDYWDAHKKNSEKKERTRRTPLWSMMNFRVMVSQYTGVGYMVGITVMIVQFVNVLQYIEEGPVGPWVNIFGILADVLVICQGVALIKLAGHTEEENNWRELNSQGVNITVGLMGVVGLTFWILKFSLTTLLMLQQTASSNKAPPGYLMWNLAKFFIRFIGIVLQLFFFYRITPSIGYQQQMREKKMAYMLLPCIMLCQLSVFINSVIDSYIYVIEQFVKGANLSVTTFAVYRIGEPLHLGFCLHMFFHFLTINNNLRVKSTQHLDERTTSVVTEDDSDGGDFQEEEEEEEEEDIAQFEGVTSALIVHGGGLDDRNIQAAQLEESLGTSKYPTV